MPPKLHKATVIIQAEEINLINSKLERGDKKELAAYLGVRPSSLSRYFSYNAKANGWTMPRVIYGKIIKYIETL